MAGGELEQIRRLALAALARREHSRVELLRKLSGKGYPEEALNAALDGLEQDALLSESRFAAAYLRSRLQKGYGPLRIIQELRARGVSSVEIDAAFAEEEPDWFALAAQQRRKHFGAELPRELKEQAKQSRFLAQRGFNGDHIRAALRGEA